jgi:hypothetical protein
LTPNPVRSDIVSFDTSTANKIYLDGASWEIAVDEEITVIGRIGSAFLDLAGFDSASIAGFGAYYIAGGLTLAGLTDAASHVFNIPSQSGRPKTQAVGLTARQLAAVTAALDNSSKDPALSATFKEMADKGVMLKVTVTNTVPSWFGDGNLEAGGIRIQAHGDGPGPNGPDSIDPNSTSKLLSSEIGSGSAWAPPLQKLLLTS